MLAELSGVNKNGDTQGYSVTWFYKEEDALQNLNSLSRAFLGDEEALGSIHRASEEELAPMRLRVREICGDQPYPAQIEAIANAVMNDITIIQGPPGTGKTETIKNILLAVRTVNPDAKIAVVSANKEAISNAEDAVKQVPSLQLAYARLGAKRVRMDFMKALATSNPALKNRMSNVNSDNDWLFPDYFLDEYPIIFSTIHSLRKCVDIEEYDYVIIDECSQVLSMIGMLAIATANHLVLLGDDEQLPPIHKKYENDWIPHVPDIRRHAPWYLDEGDNSFMKACKAAFGDVCCTILLNEHFRCHPAIIEFCNRMVYGEQLIVRTEDDGNLPIRIRWYEGDYWEYLPELSSEEIQAAEAQASQTGAEAEAEQAETEREVLKEPEWVNYNRKQIEVFIRDEFPMILDKLHANPNYGICVLAPYRSQLKVLKNRLEEVAIPDAVDIDNQLEQIEEGVNDIAQLTIHKAQGRGFDLVYIMPVQDVSRNPWSQRKDLINVAVSRAKKELCVITSSAWMSVELQKTLQGYAVDQRSDTPSGYYIQKLLKYVEEEQKHRNVGSEYGFRKTSVTSVFDKTLLYRQNRSNNDVNQMLNRAYGYQKMASPEYCMLNALLECPEIGGQYAIYREVPLRNVEGLHTNNEEVNRFIQNGARFDIVIAKEDRIQAIIEVDGSYHRSDREIIYKDQLKDQAVASLGEAFVNARFFRFATDGTSEQEMEQLVAALRSPVAATLRLNTDQLITYTGEADMPNIQMYLQTVYEHLQEGYRELKEEEQNAFPQEMSRFLQEGVGDYNHLLYQDVYILQYSLAYGLLHSRIYQAIVEDMKKDSRRNRKEAAVLDEKVIRVKSIGAGTGIDYWGFCHALSQLGAANYRIQYTGVEPENWGHRFAARAGDQVLFPEDERDFASTLSKMAEEPLEDIYIFPHSIKEVCIHTVPAEPLTNGYEYNTLQSMADFAHAINHKLTDKPVYLAFSYRFCPNGNIVEENNEGYLNSYSDEMQLEYERNYADGDTNGKPREIVDTIYGTYLIHALQSMGLQCEKVIHVRNFEEYASGASDKEHFDTSYYSAGTSFYMNGAESGDHKLRIYDGICNDDHAFDSIIQYDEEGGYGFIPKEEWQEHFHEKLPITSTGRLFFQIYKVSRTANMEPVIRKYHDRISDLAHRCTNALRDMTYAVSNVLNETEEVRMEKELKAFHSEIAARCPEDFKEYFSYPYFKQRLERDGFLEDGNITDKGNRYGIYKRRMIIRRGEEEIEAEKTMVLPFFQKIVVANLMSGYYLDYLSYLEGSLREDVGDLIDRGFPSPYLKGTADSFLNRLSACLSYDINQARIITMLEDMGYYRKRNRMLMLTEEGMDAGLTIYQKQVVVKPAMQERLLSFCRSTGRFDVAPSERKDI